MTTASQHKHFATTVLGTSEATYDKLQKDHRALAHRKYLRAILGDAFPEGSTSVTTSDHMATFVIGATGNLVDVNLTNEQLADLRSRGLTGSFGQDCYA